MGTIRTRNRREKDIIGGSIATLAIFFVLNVCQLSRGNPVFVDNPSLAQFQSGRNIRHLPCIVRKSGLSGVCMFAIDCIKQNGTHLGTCIDRFYFGSCCQMKEEKIFAEEISDNSIDQNTISHFSHESTTLSTTSAFKIPTESIIESLGMRNHSTIHPYIPVSTITHTAPKVESTTMRFITRGTARPTASTTASTTTIATTSAPTTTRKPTTEPHRRRTTTAAPILTTVYQTGSEYEFETTTMPIKFTTFQMVETSTPNKPTEPIIFEDTTMRRPMTTYRPSPTPTRTKKPLVTRVPVMNFTIPITTVRPTNKTTAKYKPTAIKRPITTKNPLPTKRPLTPSTNTTRTKPTRRPVIHHEVVNITTALPTRNHSTVATSTIKATTFNESTTRAPRPKPKPTAEIFKISRPSVAVEATTLKLQPTTTSTTTTAKPTRTTTTTTTTTTRKPTTTTTTHKPTTTTTTPKPTTTTTTTTPVPTTTTTTTRKPTRKPTTTSTTITTTTTTTTTPAPTTTTTTTTPAPTTTTTTTTTKKPTTTTTTTTTTTPRPTTQRLTTTDTPPLPTSTYRPTLVTWTTVVDNKPHNNTHVTIEETDWQPKPPPADWVPVPTIDPEVAANKNTTTGENDSSPLGPTTEGVQLSSSTTANNVNLAEATTSSPLNMNTSGATPSATTSTTTTTSKPGTHSTPRPTPSTTTSTSESSEESLTEPATPEMITDPSTEDLNATTSIPFTTMSPIPSLEGVDYRQVCGRRMFPEPRIVGGSNAAFGRWPWQISLRQWRTSTYLHKCGAALLNENWAITAAHCVDNVPPSDLLLRLGEYDLAEEEEPYGYQERRVQIVASHPQFDPRTFEYDLALLRFYEPVVFQPNIIPVCVPGSDEDFIGQTAFVTGWGRLYEDGPLPSVLQEVAVPIINNTICETMYRAAGYIEHIPHIFICAGWKKGGYDSCEGDSGGPMVLQREDDKRFILGGVISWGIGCAEPNQPGVYTRISEFRDWVNQILQF